MRFSVKDALAGGGAILVAASFVIGSFFGETTAPIETTTGEDIQVTSPASPAGINVVQICETPETTFERTDSPTASEADILTARLVEVNRSGEQRTTYMTWPDGEPNVLVEVVYAGPDDVMEPEPVTPEFASCMRSRSPTVGKEPFR